MTDDRTIDPAATYVLDEDELAELEDSRLTGIVRALSDDLLKELEQQRDDEDT